MKRTSAVLLVMLVMASCADPPVPGSGDPAAEEPASITVAATYDESTCCYIEGFLAFVQVTGSGVDVEEEFQRSDGDFADAVLEVPRGGEYTLESWVEPCSGNCGFTDPPTDHCSASVTVPDGDDLEVDLVIRSGEPCKLTVAGQ